MYFNEPKKYNSVKDSWLAKQGLCILRTAYNGVDPLDTVMAGIAWSNPNTFYLLTGKSRTGVNHVVICLNKEIYWDPSQNDSGIVGPADDGYWHVEFLGSVLMKHTPETAPAF